MDANVIVKTRNGDVRGCIADGVNIFKGIRYAAPPFGANRLKPPQPVEAWSGVRDAVTYGPKPPQLTTLRRLMCSSQTIPPLVRTA